MVKVTQDIGIILPEQPATQHVLPYKWELIVLLWFVLFLNQADRQIFNNLLPLVQTDLGLSKVQLGLVASVFTLAFGIMVPLGGYLGDVLRRKWIVVGALLFWSVATLLTGLSTGLLSLIVFRGLATGGGEAFYLPSANSLIGQFHHKTRAMALSIHHTAIYVGVVASFAAGFVGEVFGWRSAFFLFGGFGIVMVAIIILRLHDTPHKHAAARAEEQQSPSIVKVLRTFANNPTMLLISMAFAAHIFASIGYLTWMPTFLHEKHGMSITAAGFAALFYHHLFAFIGVLAGGKLSDHWAKRRRSVRMEFEYAGLFLGVPFIVLMGMADSTAWCLIGLSGFGLCRGIYDSNLFAALFDVVEPRLRSSAMGVMICFSFIVGSASPVLLGLAEISLGMSTSIALLGLSYAAAGMFIAVAVFATLTRDFYQECEKEPEGSELL